MKDYFSDLLAKYGFLFVLIAILALPVSVVLLSASPKIDKDTILLTENNTLLLNAEVDGESEGDILTDAKTLDHRLASGEPLYLYLQTPGGSVQAGEEMIEALSAMGRPVHTITAFAASMGFHIAENLGIRYILRSGVMMSHRASGGIQGSFGGQEPSQMQNRYALMQREMREMDMRVVKRTNGKQTLESYQKAFDNELYVRGTEAIEQGYADKVVKVKCDSSLSGTTSHTTTLLGFKVDYEIDRCPINSSPHNVKVSIGTNKGYMNEEKFLKGGGGFGLGCLQQAAMEKAKLCALDMNMGWETVSNIRRTFILNFEKSRSSIIPMGL